MKVLLFEWLTGGGLWQDQVLPDFECPMQRQGRQMVAAMASDLSSADIDVELAVDERLTPWMSQLTAGINYLAIDSAEAMKRRVLESSQDADYIMLIAPECDSSLLKCVDWVKPLDDKLVSPDAPFVKLASSKTATINALQKLGFKAVPTGVRLSRFLEDTSEGNHFSWPAVLKPDDGAGSEGVQLITDRRDLERSPSRSAEHYRIESFVSGTPVSVSVLCGAVENQILVPTGQVFDQEPFGEYVGTRYPLAPKIAQRAIRLAREAVLSLPNTRGYIGIDMIISDNEPQFDCLIEVNPRLTMSYLKLREIYAQNLAILMLQTATARTKNPAEQNEDRSDNSPVKKHCIFQAPDL